jgi:hypothetical protein
MPRKIKHLLNEMSPQPTGSGESVSSLLEKVITAAAPKFKDAKSALDFVRKVREVALLAGCSQVEWPDEIPDWVAELPGGSYNM